MANERGNRVIFDTVTGRVIFQTGEIFDSTTPMPHEDINGLDYVDLEFGLFDINKYHIDSINIETKQPILKKFDWIKDEASDDELIVQKDEELALLKAQLEIGGIA